MLSPLDSTAKFTVFALPLYRCVSLSLAVENLSGGTAKISHAATGTALVCVRELLSRMSAADLLELERVHLPAAKEAAGVREADVERMLELVEIDETA